jgi:methionyl-tRNA formyltransferase
MKIVFFGSGNFGIPTLKELLASSHEVAAVVTQPDRKKGRGWGVQAVPVKAVTEQVSPATHIFQPDKISDPAFVEELKDVPADVFVVVDYGQFLSDPILKMPAKYCVNLHPSLLPKYRGAAPVNRAILEGDAETGNTVIKMNERMDAGDIIIQERTKIFKDEDAESLLMRLSQEGSDLLIKALAEIEEGREKLASQDENAATYAPKLTKAEGEIDWTASCDEIIRKVKGMKPWPAAYTFIGGKMLKVVSAQKADLDYPEGIPGSILSDSKFIVSLSKGAVLLKTVQLEGKKAMASSEFLKGSKLKKGTVLGR